MYLPVALESFCVTGSVIFDSSSRSFGLYRMRKATLCIAININATKTNKEEKKELVLVLQMLLINIRDCEVVAAS